MFFSSVAISEIQVAIDCALKKCLLYFDENKTD